MELTLVIVLLSIIAVLLFANIVMFAAISQAFRKNQQAMMLIIEAMSKLAKAQKSSLSYLQHLDGQLKSDDGR
jgi:type II secretory pathway pseudopilin PulG